MSDNQQEGFPATQVKVITIAVGCVTCFESDAVVLMATRLNRGATCSGKTTLAKHLRNCLQGSFIIHQDVSSSHSDLSCMTLIEHA